MFAYLGDRILFRECVLIINCAAVLNLERMQIAKNDEMFVSRTER